MKIFGTSVLVVIIVAMLTGCCACKRYQKKYGKPLQGTVWVLTQFEGQEFKDGSEDRYCFTLEADNRMHGRGDCNSIMGGYTAYDDGYIKFDKMASTRAFCQNQTMEDKFIQLLTSAESYKMDGPMLMLFADSKLVAMFQGHTPATENTKEKR